MASPLKSAKKSVDLAAPGKLGSRIRRDPPPPKPKEMSLAERNERDRRWGIIGIILFALALFVIWLGFSS
jgi:hypothetical protein